MNIFCIRPKGFNVGNDVIYLGLQAALEEFQAIAAELEE